MSIAFLNMAWWAICLTVVGSILGAFILVWGIIASYLIIRGKRFNKKNESCLEEKNTVKPRPQPKEDLDETIE